MNNIARLPTAYDSDGLADDLASELSEALTGSSPRRPVLRAAEAVDAAPAAPEAAKKAANNVDQRRSILISNTYALEKEIIEIEKRRSKEEADIQGAIDTIRQKATQDVETIRRNAEAAIARVSDEADAAASKLESDLSAVQEAKESEVSQRRLLVSINQKSIEMIDDAGVK